MGFFKKLKRSVKKRTKKITKGVTKAAKTVSGYKYAKKFYDKNKKGINQWGSTALRAGLASYSMGGSEALGLGNILTPQQQEAASQFIDGYNSADYVNVSSPRTSSARAKLPSRRISSTRKQALPFWNAGTGSNVNVAGTPVNKTALMVGGAALIGAMFLMMAQRGRK